MTRIAKTVKEKAAEVLKIARKYADEQRKGEFDIAKAHAIQSVYRAYWAINAPHFEQMIVPQKKHADNRYFDYARRPEEIGINVYAEEVVFYNRKFFGDIAEYPIADFFKAVEVFTMRVKNCKGFPIYFPEIDELPTEETRVENQSGRKIA